LTFSEPGFLSGLRPEMSLEFEYRRLAAASLDLSKRAVALADKTRLLLIAEAWFDLADRVTRKHGDANRQDDGSAEHPVAKSLSTSSSKTVAGPGPPHPRTRFGRIDSGMQ
jgi:hypothetical protein